MSSFFRLVIISSKCILNSVSERGKLWRNPLLISTGSNSLLLNFINFCFVCKYPLLPLAMCLGYVWISKC